MPRFAYEDIGVSTSIRTFSAVQERKAVIPSTTPQEGHTHCVSKYLLRTCSFSSMRHKSGHDKHSANKTINMLYWTWLTIDCIELQLHPLADAILAVTFLDFGFFLVEQRTTQGPYLDRPSCIFNWTQYTFTAPSLAWLNQSNTASRIACCTAGL